MSQTKDLSLGDKLTVITVPGRSGKAIGHHRDGRVILFDQNNQFANLVYPFQTIECEVVFLQEKFIIVKPLKEPVKAEASRSPEKELETVEADEGELADILEELEKIDHDKMIDELEKLEARANKNSKSIPRALIHIIGTQRLIIKILMEKKQVKKEP